MGAGGPTRTYKRLRGAAHAGDAAIVADNSSTAEAVLKNRWFVIPTLLLWIDRADRRRV
jgi:hypothetical protein